MSWLLVLSSFCRQVNWVSERWGLLPKVTQLIKQGQRLRPRSISFQSLQRLCSQTTGWSDPIAHEVGVESCMSVLQAGQVGWKSSRDRHHLMREACSDWGMEQPLVPVMWPDASSSYLGPLGKQGSSPCAFFFFFLRNKLFFKNFILYLSIAD